MELNWIKGSVDPEYSGLAQYKGHTGKEFKILENKNRHDINLIFQILPGLKLS